MQATFNLHNHPSLTQSTHNNAVRASGHLIKVANEQTQADFNPFRLQFKLVLCQPAGATNVEKSLLHSLQISSLSSTSFITNHP
jgi:hypothetical protein